MKVLLNQRDLLPLITKVARAASTNSTIPVLNCMQIEVSDGKLIATAMDLEIGIRARTGEIQAEAEGKVLVNARHLEELVRHLPNGVITMEMMDNKLTIRYGRNCARLNTLNSTELLSWPDSEVLEKLAISQEVLKDALQTAGHAVAKNHYRPVFTGVLLDLRSDELHFVGTDTHRLAFYRVKLDEEKEDFTAIIPARSVAEMVKHLKGEESISIGIGGNNIFFYRNDFELFSRTINGQFPDYMSAIPDNFVSSFKFDVGEFQQGLQRITTLPKSKEMVNTLRLVINDTEATMHGSSDLAGEIQETCSIKEQEGEKLSVLLNAGFLQEALKYEERESKMSFSGSLTPALIKSSEDYLVVLVPLRESA